MENSATCYLVSEDITVCRVTAILLDGLGSFLSCGTHWRFIFFQNYCIYSSLVLLSIVLLKYLGLQSWIKGTCFVEVMHIV
jgi:hypothetical protein